MPARLPAIDAGVSTMRAEAQILVDRIKESLALLRRHL